MAKAKIKNKDNRRSSKNLNFISDYGSFIVFEQKARKLVAQLKTRSVVIFQHIIELIQFYKKVLQSSLNASNRKTRRRNGNNKNKIIHILPSPSVLKQLKEHLDAFYQATKEFLDAQNRKLARRVEKSAVYGRLKEYLAHIMARATMNTVIKNKSAKPNKTGAKGGKKKASFNKQLHDNKGQIFIGLAALVIIFIIFQNYQLELQKKTTTNNRGKSIPVVAIVEGVINSGDKKAREPKAMIVGAKSCGTSALQNYLSLHPYVALTAVKETHYYDKNLHRGEYWYKNEFSLTTPEQSGVDRTDTYLTSSRDVASRVYERNPTAKIIVMVCDPVIRAYLDYYNIYNGIKEMSVKRNLTMKGATTFSRYVDKYMEYIETVEEDPSTINFEKFEDIVFKIDDIMPEASIITNGLYYFHVQRWFRHFDRSQVLILDADTLTATPWDVMIDLQNFLELPDLIGEQNFYQNTTLGVYCLRSEKGYKCPEPNSIASLGSLRHYSISGRDQRRLKEFYENYTDMFYQLIGTGEEKEEAEQQV